MRLPPLNAVRAFDAVARLGSVRAAADELAVTPAAVSQQLRVLEAHLGLALTERRGRGIALTDRAARGTARLRGICVPSRSPPSAFVRDARWCR